MKAQTKENHRLDPSQPITSLGTQVPQDLCADANAIVSTTSICPPSIDYAKR